MESNTSLTAINPVIVRRLREIAKLTVDEAARLGSCSPSWLNRVERGVVDGSPELLKRMFDALLPLAMERALEQARELAEMNRVRVAATSEARP